MMLEARICICLGSYKYTKNFQDNIKFFFLVDEINL
jgi:hypothetical protein